MDVKDSFVLYNSYYDLIEDLDMEQRGALFTAILEHSIGTECINLDQITKLAYRVISSQLDRDREKWEKTCKKRAESGRKGGIASGQSRSKTKQIQANEANAISSKQNEAKGSKTKQIQANEAEYEYEYESDYDYEDDYENESESEHVPQANGGFVDSIREKFFELFGRNPDRPFASGIKNKLEHISETDVLDVMRFAYDAHPDNPEAYIMAALNDRQNKKLPSTDKPDDKDRPLDQWERDWLADIERRRQRDKEAIQ